MTKLRGVQSLQSVTIIQVLRISSVVCSVKCNDESYICKSMSDSINCYMGDDLSQLRKACNEEDINYN